MLFFNSICVIFLIYFEIIQKIDRIHHMPKNAKIRMLHSHPSIRPSSTQSHHISQIKPLKKTNSKETIASINRDGVFSSQYEHYERLTENGRLLKCLINPRRDRVIVKSLDNVRNANAFGKRSRSDLKKSKKKGCEGQRGKSVEQYELIVENKNLGNRIINARSTGYNLFFKQKIKRTHKKGQKINQGVAAFFKPPSLRKSIPPKSAMLKAYYGMGPTIISLSNIQLHLNPPLKNQELICLQLQVNQSNNNVYTTNGIPYEVLKRQKVKFAVRLNEIGEFAPLKFWKFHEVNSIQVGILDLNFGRYQQRKEILSEMESSKLIEQKNEKGKKRVIAIQTVNSKLRKSKLDEVNGEVSLDYLIYRKKYV